MTRAALVKLLIAQSVVLVLVGWAGVYFARDEFLLATEADEGEEIRTSASPAADDEAGVPTVKLSAAAQRNVGIELATPQPATLAGQTELPATVLDAQALAELHGRLQAARHELAAAGAVAAASGAEQQRVQGLYDDDRNASRRALEAATAQAAADAARQRAAQAALTALRDGARASWGPRIAAWLDVPDGAALQGIFSGRDALLRVTVPANGSLEADAELQMSMPGSTVPRRLQPLGAAPAADAPGLGRGLLYRAAGGGLSPGMRLAVRHADGAPQPGVLVPASAVVWHAGQPWVYVRESDADEPAADSSAPTGAATKARPAQDDDDDHPAKPAAGASSPASSAAALGPGAFQRRAVPHARRQGDRWFLPGFEEDDPVVVLGAQVLLSEELKYQIRNENDD